MRNSANNFADLRRESIASRAGAAMTGASSSVAFNEANDVLSLHLAEIGRLDATIDALQAEQGAAKAKQHATSRAAQRSRATSQAENG